MVTLVITCLFSIRAVKKCACCFKRSFYIVYTCLKNILFRTKLEVLQGRTGLKYAQSLASYLFDHQENKKKSAKSFKDQFRRIFTDVKLLVASAVHPHFKLGVVARLNNELLPEVKSQLLKEISENIPEGHAVTDVSGY